ncbi:MAG: hypothetical protein ABIP55_10850, partial [Tepidisphaeraceae bacterium]
MLPTPKAEPAGRWRGAAPVAFLHVSSAICAPTGGFMKTIQKLIYTGFATCALASASMPAFS